MTTGQNIHDTLPLQVGQTAADTLLALQAAARSAWPTIRIDEWATSVATIAANTFEYSLSAVTDLTTEEGVAQVYVSPLTATTEPKILIRDVTQFYDQNNTAWMLVFGHASTHTYNGCAVNIKYQRKPAVPSAIGNTLEIPDDYALWSVMHWYGVKGVTMPLADSRAFENLLIESRDRLEVIRRRLASPVMQRTTKVVKDRRV